MTINDAGYYNSEKNDAEGNPKSNPEVDTHTSNVSLQQRLLINRTLPIITTTIYHQIPYRVAACGGTPHARMIPTTKPVTTDAARSSARVLQICGCVSWTVRDGTTPQDANVSGTQNGTVLIGGTTVSPEFGKMWNQEILGKHESIGSVETGDI